MAVEQFERVVERIRGRTPVSDGRLAEEALGHFERLLDVRRLLLLGLESKFEGSTWRYPW
ncbi:hypothetical protein [Halorubrum sp. 48-1-W]|uniref:hypothetical protein n=1 Tax=Halorubrum sp. 48-1-W TaxID=2249761 RepID=UPI001F541AE7|nr:hypothetical protein [Halorubrum sp. 48-1-W]